MNAQISNISDDFQNLKQSYTALKYDFTENQDILSQSLGPSIEHLKKRASEFGVDSKKKLQEAHKAVYDKNKQISDLFNKNTELQAANNQLQGQVRESIDTKKLVYDKNKEIGDLFNKNQALTQQL